MAYKTIEITNFRGIDHLTINDLSQINIFVGRNNTGKSTCLEAIALLSSGSSGFKNSFKEDMLEFITFRRAKSDLGWNYLIRTGSEKSIIIGFEDIDGGTRTEGVTISKTSAGLGLSKNEELVESIKDQLMHEVRRERDVYSSRRKSSSLAKNRMYFYYNNSREHLALLYGEGTENEVVSASKSIPNIVPHNKDTLFIGNFEEVQAELHDRSAEKGRLFSVIDRLRDKFPEIQDLRRIGDVIYIFYKNGTSIPLATMGDGFKASLLVSLSVQTISNGILILEEPENYLHPGLMMHLIEELLIAAKQHNIQIFTSTHSEEFLKFCIERSKNLGISIVKMSKMDDKFEAEVIKKNEAAQHMNELGIDLRGF